MVLQRLAEVEERLGHRLNQVKSQMITMEEGLVTKLDSALEKLDSLEKRMEGLARSSSSPGGEVRLFLLVILYKKQYLGEGRGDEYGSGRWM